MAGRINWRRLGDRNGMRRQGVEDVKGGTPIVAPLVKQQPPRRKLSKAELREQAETPVLAWRAGQTQGTSFSLIAPLAVGLALSGCTTGTSEAPSPSAGVSIGQRDLTPEEKQVIMDAVAPSLRNPASAKYHWANFPAVVTEDSVNYCATVDAQSPHAAYNGRQAYIVKAQMSGNRVSSAVIGLVAGGKDFAIVTKMCAKYGLDPQNAS